MSYVRFLQLANAAVEAAVQIERLHFTLRSANDSSCTGEWPVATISTTVYLSGSQNRQQTFTQRENKGENQTRPCGHPWVCFEVWVHPGQQVCLVSVVVWYLTTVR